jgi:hypothetical protein
MSVLKALGQDFAKGLNFAVSYSVPVEKLIGVLYPAAAPATTEIAAATTLVQNAVLLVEQKYAASGVQSGTGAQKLAEVLTLSQAAVSQLLASAGITADATYITNLVNAVVAILNVQPASVQTSPVSPSAPVAAASAVAAVSAK